MQTADTIYDNVSHLNYGFQHEEQRPPPYAPPSGINPALPQYPGPQNPQHLYQNSERYSPAQSLHQYTPQTAPVNTHHTVTPGPYINVNMVHKASRRKKWPIILGIVITLLVVAGVIAVVLWFYGVFDCLQGRRCQTDNECVSFSQWCDGEHNCPSGDNETQCFRLFGSNFLLQMYSNVTQKWENVCSDGWNDSLGMQACEEMGYERSTYVGYEEFYSSASTDYMLAKTDSLSSSNLTGFLSKTSYCPSNKAVALKCIVCGQNRETRIVGGTTVTLRGCGHGRSACKFPEGICVVGLSLHLTGSSLRLTVCMTNVRPVCLPNKGMYFTAPQECYVTGWGALFSGGSPSQTLQEAKIQLIDRTTCNSQPVYDRQITDTMICAGKLEGGVDSCQGDSGGPLVTKENSLWWLVGDTSWGDGCAFRNKPGVYGNVTYFLDWIYEQMRKY